MNLIIVGAGKVGETLVADLANEQHDIVVLDVDGAKVSNIVNKYDVNGIVGSGLERSALLDAGIENVDFLIACTSRDETNILCSVLGRKLGAKSTVARVRDPEYFKEMENLKEDLGVDYFFNPERRTAIEIEKVLKFPSAKSVETFADGMANMVVFTIHKDNPIIGKSLVEISKDYQNKVLCGTVLRGDEVIIPRGNLVFKEGDEISLIGSEAEIAVFCKKLKIFKPRAKTVFITGGGKIAYYLAERLTNSGVSVKIVEKDKIRAEELSKILGRATVLNFDATEQEALDEEKLCDSDACVTLTGEDEENVIISLYAKECGVGKVITKIDKPSIVNMVKSIGLDTVVSPRKAIADHIIRFIRSNQAKAGGGINTLYRLYNKVEALEFTVSPNIIRTGVAIRDLQIDKRVLIGGVVRKDEFILPTGETKLEIGDKVIVVTSLSSVTELSQVVK